MAACILYACVTCRTRTGVELFNIDDLFEMFTDRAFELYCIWRTVIDDDNLVLAKLLSNDRVERLADKFSGIIRRYHDRYFRRRVKDVAADPKTYMFILRFVGLHEN